MTMQTLQQPSSKHRPALRLVGTKQLTRVDWLALRKQGIGSSDAAAAVGLNPYKSQLELWLEKTDRDASLPKLDPQDEESPAYWGNILEPIVANHYGRRTDKPRTLTKSPWIKRPGRALTTGPLKIVKRTPGPSSKSSSLQLKAHPATQKPNSNRQRLQSITGSEAGVSGYPTQRQALYPVMPFQPSQRSYAIVQESPNEISQAKRR